jgi:exopolyphosphatase/guanosine-5'-triphosphate,3'-diphosphate pyrophosphatase
MSDAEERYYYAVVDLGSNTTKLTVVTIRNGKTSILEQCEAPGKLSEGMAESNLLQPQAIDRNIRIIAEWQNMFSKYGQVITRIVGTGAARRALNGDTLIMSMREHLGLELEIISERREAELIYKGTVYDFEEGKRDYAVLNVGGSTTELVLGTKYFINHIYNLPLGTRQLNESFLRSDPPTEGEHQRLVQFVRSCLTEYKIPKPSEKPVLLHTGGELEYVQIAGCKLSPFNLSPAHPYKILLSHFREFADRIRRMKNDQLRALRAKNPEWMDGAIVTNAVAICVAEKLGVTEIVPSDRNMINGLLVEMNTK